jgi:hypothetical protein
MTNHILGDQDGYMLAPVVHGNSQADHIGQHHGTTRPGLDRPAIILLRGLRNLFRQMRIDEWTFSNTTWHQLIP